ncbi:MAG: extracellular solute-binding protein [Clostridia bacterium]|nr:extracellular solute-binding protein [Clostridia bacterium]
MKKRILSLLACGALAASAVAGFTACGFDGITVWGSAAQQDTLKEMVKEFKKANPDVKCDIRVGIGEEDMAYSNVGKDVSAAADVYAYSNDQLINLLRVGGLAKVGGQLLETVKADNSEDSVKSCAIGWGTAQEAVYGYPFASDNGYFMYYNKSVLGENDVKSLETIISKCETAGKKIAWALDVPWYVAGFFFTFGGEYGVEHDANYNESNLSINFNEPEVGIKASKAMAMLANSSAYAGKGTDDSTIITGLKTGTTAVAVSGTWNAKRIQDDLGENYGVCELPTVTIDGDTQHLSSFKGYKLFGVNPTSKYLVESHRLAAFLSNGEMQQLRFEKHLIGPTNVAASNIDAIKNDPTFAALNAQNAHAKEQTTVPSNFWEPLKAYGLYIIDKIINDTTYQTYLDNMVTGILKK